VRAIFSPGADGRGDAELIAAARAGDPDAYGELTARHADAARRLAALLVPPADLEGLVAEAFAKVRLALQRGAGPDLAFRPYLLTAVRRLHLDHAPAAPQPAGSPADAAAARAFTSLAEPWRMVLWHTEVEGQGTEQVAGLLGQSPDTVPALVARAQEGMRIAWLTLHEPAADEECQWTRHHLGAYVRKVAFDRDAARVEGHLDGCEHCAAICHELTEGAADLRAILAPLVLGTAAAGYVASVGAATEAPVAGSAPPPVRAPARVGASIGAGVGTAVRTGVRTVVRTGVGRVSAAIDGIGTASRGATGRLREQVGRTKGLVATRTAATAVGGVAAVAVLAGGAFVVVQTADGSPEASAEAGLFDGPDDPATSSVREDDGSSEGTDPARSGTATSARPTERIPDGPSAAGSGEPSADPAEGLADALADDPTEDAPDPSFPDPTDPGGRPSQSPSDGPGQQPAHQPTQQPTRPPAQQPSQHPTQQPTQLPTQLPTQVPTQAPLPPTDLSISSSSRDLAGLVWAIDVRITGLAPGRTATLQVRPSGGSSTGLTMDRRCSRVAGDGATCSVGSTPASFHFNANALSGRSSTITFTVSPDGDSDANTGDNSTSVTIRP
jgi:DNA-directed RNA polymerase specialized sigma24 family protein